MSASRFVIYGAGGIGATIGARLHMAGYSVVLIARGAHYQKLATDGLHFVTPDGEHHLQIPVVDHPKAIDWHAQDRVALCMKTQHTIDALDSLGAVAGDEVPVFCVQNGVTNERFALRRFVHVYASLVNLPAQHIEPGQVITYAQGKGGILDSGCYPNGVDEVLEDWTDALTQAGFSALADAQVMRKKYAKLLSNLVNALQVLTELNEQSRDLIRALRKEALACYAAAGIDCATADEVRARMDGVYQMVDIEGWPRGGGSSWQSAVRGTGDIETDYLNGEITLLGRLYQVPTPINSAIAHLAKEVIHSRVGVQPYTSMELQRAVAEHTQANAPLRA